MEPNFMCLHTSRLQLFQAAQDEFRKTYPFLKFEFLHPPDQGLLKATDDDEHQQRQARYLLKEDIGLSDELTVAAFEQAIKEWFGMPVRVLRKSGNLWSDSGHTGDWSLKKQNDLGNSVTSALQ